MLEIGTFNVDIAGTEEKGDGTCDLRRYPDGFPEEKWLRLLRTAYDCIERSVGAAPEELTSAGTVFAMSISKMRRLLSATEFSGMHAWLSPLCDEKQDIAAIKETFKSVIEDLKDLQQYCMTKPSLSQLKTFRGASVVQEFLVPLLMWAGIPLSVEPTIMEEAERLHRQRRTEFLLQKSKNSAEGDGPSVATFHSNKQQTRSHSDKKALLEQLRRLCTNKGTKKRLRAASIALETSVKTPEVNECDDMRPKTVPIKKNCHDDVTKKRRDLRLLDTVSLSLTGGITGTLPDIKKQRGRLVVRSARGTNETHVTPATPPASARVRSAGGNGTALSTAAEVTCSEESQKMAVGTARPLISSLRELLNNPSYDEEEGRFLKELPEFKAMLTAKKKEHHKAYERKIEKAETKKKEDEKLMLVRHVAREARIGSAKEPLDHGNEAFESLKKEGTILRRSMSVKVLVPKEHSLATPEKEGPHSSRGTEDKKRFTSVFEGKKTFKNAVLKSLSSANDNTGSLGGTNDELINSVFGNEPSSEGSSGKVDRRRLGAFGSKTNLQPMELQAAEDILHKPPSLRTAREINVLVDKVSHLNFFRQLRRDVCRATCRVMTYKKVYTGDFLFRYGDSGTAYYIILKGSVDLLIPKEEYTTMRKDMEREVKQKEEDEDTDSKDKDANNAPLPPRMRSHTSHAGPSNENADAAAVSRRRRSSIFALGKVQALGAAVQSKRRTSITDIKPPAVPVHRRRASITSTTFSLHAAAAAAASAMHEHEQEKEEKVRAGTADECDSTHEKKDGASISPDSSSRQRQRRRRGSMLAVGKFQALVEPRRAGERRRSVVSSVATSGQASPATSPAPVEEKKDSDEGDSQREEGMGSQRGRRRGSLTTVVEAEQVRRPSAAPDFERTLLETDDVLEKVARSREGHQVVNTLKTGAAFGEIALLKDVPRTASVLAREDTILMAIDKSDYLRVLKADAERRRKEKIALLRRTSGFKSLPNYVYAGNLVTIMEEVTYPCHTTLVEQGAFSPDIFIIKEGTCRVSRKRETAPAVCEPSAARPKPRTLKDHAHYFHRSRPWKTERLQIAELGVGDMIGLESFVYSDNRRARETVETATECILLRVKVAELFHQLHRKYRGGFREYYESRVAFHERRFEYLQRATFKGETIDKILQGVKARVEGVQKNSQSGAAGPVAESP